MEPEYQAEGGSWFSGSFVRVDKELQNFHETGINQVFAKKLKEDEGGIVVEFAIALLFLFFFLLCFFQIAMILLAHERITYAAYTGARANAVKGNVGRAVRMVKGKTFSVSGSTVTVKETLKVPIDFRNIYRKTESTFDIESKFTIPREPNDSGDNAL